MLYYVMLCYQGCRISITTSLVKFVFAGSLGENIKPRSPSLHFSSSEPTPEGRVLPEGGIYWTGSYVSPSASGQLALQSSSRKAAKLHVSPMGSYRSLRLHLQFWQSVSNSDDYVLEGQYFLKECQNISVEYVFFSDLFGLESEYKVNPVLFL